MTRTTLLGTTTTTCRARTAFPWQGVLRESVTFTGHGSYARGTLVAVTGQTEAGFLVRVGRAREAPAESDVSGPAGRARVDEAVGAVIESSLIGKPNIGWAPGSGSWKKLPYVAGQDLLLTEREEGEPPRHAMVYKGERVEAQPDGEYYLIIKNDVVGRVPNTMLDLDTSIPPCTGQVELLCYEMGMYAAALAGLCPDFVRLATSSREGVDGPVYWVLASGGTMNAQTFGRDALGTVVLQRGDFVLFYDDEAAVTSVHTAVATGNAQRVYSLWDVQAKFPVVTSIQELFDLRGLAQEMVCVRTATPGWHLGPG